MLELSYMFRPANLLVKISRYFIAPWGGGILTFFLFLFLISDVFGLFLDEPLHLAKLASHFEFVGIFLQLKRGGRSPRGASCLPHPFFISENSS